MYKEYTEAIGGLREDFFAEMLIQKNYPFSYLKSVRGAKTPDYLIELKHEKIIVEIGGKGKGREKFKGINAKKSLILTHSNKCEDIWRPLFLIGYL